MITQGLGKRLSFVFRAMRIHWRILSRKVTSLIYILKRSLGCVQNELFWGAGVDAIKPVRWLQQLSNILEPGGQSEKSPGKEDNLGIKSSNYRFLKSYKGLCAIIEMVECLELSCVSAKIMLFLLELYSLGTALGTKAGAHHYLQKQ